MKAVFTLAFALFVAAASAHPPIVSERTDQVVIDVPAMCTFISSVMQTPGLVNASDPSASSPSFVDVAAYLLAGFQSIPLGVFPTWNITIGESLLVQGTLLNLTNGAIDCSSAPKGAPFPFHPYSQGLEGEVLAPKSHTIVFRNQLVQVVHWTLWAHYQEPFHTHVYPSLTFLVVPAGRTYFNSTGQVVSSTPPVANATSIPLHLGPQDPEWFHSIKSEDFHTYQVIRIFFFPQSFLSYVPHLV